MAERAVAIREVGPRDGLQREAPLEPARRLALIEGLAGCGFTDMEVAAFVSERAVPSMAGAAEVVAGLPSDADCTWWALVPNLTGAERAMAAGVDHLSVTVSASAEYSRRNVQMSVEESTAQAMAIIAAAPVVDVVISCAFGSPYEYVIDRQAVASLVGRFTEAGASVTLADTTGVASPRTVAGLLSLTGSDVGLHLHDTRGTALVNAYAALDLGVARFDTSVGGLGGSPFADDAGGNLATEDFVYLLGEIGTPSCVDLPRLLEVSGELREWLGRPLASRVAETELRRRSRN
jgi:hydroxymethylglutaryl-CoA lyase